MESSSSPAKQAKYCCPINDLKESDLEEIFKRLAAYERLIVSEVCRRWYEISRKAWLDIKSLDLSPIPGKHIRAIMTQCPNLQSVFAVKKSFGSNELACLADHASLARVRLFDCKFELNPNSPCIVQSIFSDHLEHAPWTELTLHDATFWLTPCNFEEFRQSPTKFLLDATLPASLTHLQLSGLRKNVRSFNDARLFLDGIDRLENLECFSLHSSRDEQSAFSNPDLRELVRFSMCSAILEKIARLKNLRELCLGPAFELCEDSGLPLGRLVSSLPKLEVLFLNCVDGDQIADDLTDLIKTNSVLRILLLTSTFLVEQPILFPSRKRFPNGLASVPLPLLHIFVGSHAAQNTRFVKSAWDAARVYPISQPMPQFLERVDIAPIFDGVWVAAKIKDAAKHGGSLWYYEWDQVFESVSRQRRNSSPL